MALFQNSVLKKYLSLQDEKQVEKAFHRYTKYFLNPKIQSNIRDSKEEQFQEGFLRELFVNVLGYTLNPSTDFNLTTELKNEKGAKKADGAILKNGQAIGVIELKSTKTKDLEKVRQQAFDYKSNQTGCVYVITSNFEKLRFYINNAVEYEEFNLFTINKEQFLLLYLCLSKENLLINNLPLTIKQASILEEEEITKCFYDDYSVFKRELFRNLVKLNMKNEVYRNEITKNNPMAFDKNVKRNLFKKSQKLIDRFLFIFFAEDRGLLPPNSILEILNKWNKLKDLDEEVPLYSRYKKYFNYLDQGRLGTDKTEEIFSYNGGLFNSDSILDSLIISDSLLYKHTKNLSRYGFESQVDVNILGHIFESSLNEIESVNAEIEGSAFDKQKTKRKSDGVFYTPKYITKYIVDHTIGELCAKKKNSIGLDEDNFRSNRQKETKKRLLDLLEVYRKWLLQLTVIDPSCGSGAFLNEALNFLISEHQYIDELQTRLFGGGFIFPNVENTVLENNIYGVDLNEEAVEIAKLSLWLRTAQPRRKLNDLSNNIKCGNSLIDSKALAGDKAFVWEEEFKQVFDGGGFDIVIGNPPWGAKIPTDDLSYIKKNQQDIVIRMIDSFMFFVDKSMKITSSNGLFGLITPDVILYQKDNEKLRRKIVKNSTLTHVINLGDGIFQDVARPSAIIIASKFSESKYKTTIGNFNKNSDMDIFSIKMKKIKSEIFHTLPNTIFATKEIQGYELLKRLSNIKLKDVIDNDGIQRGVSPDLKDAFIVDKKTINKWSLESQKIKRTITGGVDLKRFNLLSSDKNILYITKKDNPKEFPNIIKYVERYLDRITCSEVKKGKHPFYTLHRPRNENIFTKKEKIVGVITGDKIITAVDNEMIYPTDGLFILSSNENHISNKALSSVLNSKLITYLYRLISSERNRTMAQIKPILVAELPMVDINQRHQHALEEYYDYFEREITVFSRSIAKMYLFFEESLNVSSTKKLRSWYQLDFKGFIQEINKVLKNERMELLTKSDEIEWFDVFNEKKDEVLRQKKNINSTEAEYNKIVYDIFGLTSEEIDIIEASYK